MPRLTVLHDQRSAPLPTILCCTIRWPLTISITGLHGQSSTALCLRPESLSGSAWSWLFLWCLFVIFICIYCIELLMNSSTCSLSHDESTRRAQAATTVSANASATRASCSEPERIEMPFTYAVTNFALSVTLASSVRMSRPVSICTLSFIISLFISCLH